MPSKFSGYQPKAYATADVFAAACAAQRINGGYLKILPADAPEDAKINRNLMREILENTILIDDVDREHAAEVRRFFNGYTFRIMQGKVLSEFDSNALRLANSEEIKGNYDLAIVASLPSCYVRGEARNVAERRIRESYGNYLATPGTKISAQLEVLKTIYSEKYQVFFVTGITSENNIVFFSYKHRPTNGTFINVTGKVKAHRDGSTQLSHTKVIEQ